MRLIDADAIPYDYSAPVTDKERIDGVPTIEAVPKDEYRELLKAARKMHLWIFLNTADEEKAYEECELTDEMNALLGYSGSFVINNAPIVRCKDCIVKQICRYKTGLGDNGFCSQGEKKDDG